MSELDSSSELSILKECLLISTESSDSNAMEFGGISRPYLFKPEAHSSDSEDQSYLMCDRDEHRLNKNSDCVWDGISILPAANGIVGIAVHCVLWSFVLFVFSTMLWRLYYRLSWDPDSNLPLPPGCMGFPFVGETLSYLKSDTNFNISRREKYGRVHRTHLFGHPVIKVFGADNVRQILMGEHITVEAMWPASTRALLNGLSTSAYDTHRFKKKLVLQALSPSVVAGHVVDMQELVRRHIQKWCNKGELLGHDVCKHLSMSLAVTIIIGFHLEEEKLKRITDAFKVFVDNMFSLPWNLPGTGFSKALKSRSMILKEIKERLQLETKEHSIIDELKNLDQEGVYSADDVAEAILELWFAGNDTSTSAACSVLLTLGRNERVVLKLEEELKQHGLYDSEVDLTFDILKRMTYLDHVVKEVLRLLPPVAWFMREVKKTLQMEGYQIPKGWRVLCSIRDTHETTEVFENRETFLPERWSEMEPKLKEVGQRFHYIPFGAGARACPGEHFGKTYIKVFIVELIRTCTWKLKRPTTKIEYFPLPHPVDGLPVTFTFRNHGNATK